MDDSTNNTSSDPLVECALFICDLYQNPSSKAALISGLPLQNGRLTPKLFTEAMRKQGFNSQIRRRRLRALSSLVLPCVLILKNNDACILQSVEQGQAEIITGHETFVSKKIPLAELKNIYSGYAILIKTDYQFDSRASEFHVPHKESWFFGTLWHYRYYYLQVLLGALLVNVFALASPIFVMNVYDRVVPNNAFDTLWALAIGIFIIYFFDFILKLSRTHLIDSSGKKVDVLLSKRIFSHIMSLRMAHKPSSAGAFSNNLREFETLRDFFTSASLVSLVDLPFIFLFIFVMGLIGGPVMFVPIVAIPIVLLCAFFISLGIGKAIATSMQGSSQKHALAVEALASLETTRCLSAEGELQKQWEQSVIKTTQAGHISRFLSSIASNFTGWVIQLVTVFVVIIGVYRIEEGLMTMGSLIACSMLSGRCLAPLTQITSLLTRYQQAKSGLKGLNEIMALPTERPKGKKFLNRSVLTGNIEFQDISFTYPNEKIACFNNLTLRIKAGEKIGLIGRVGAGKTSLFKLLMNLYDVDEGSILIDGIDTRQIDPADLRQHIAYAPQENTLFFGSIKYNIMLGKPWATDDEMLKAAEYSGVARFANKHPLGYNMPIAERGENLSGGQKKAVNMTRLFMSKAKILLLDEPTIAMDNTAERHMIESIKDFGRDKTVLLITHKRSLLTLVDRLVIFENGKLVADGPRDKVLAMLSGKSKEGNIS